MSIYQRPSYEHVIQLLTDNNLPTRDLSPKSIELFLAYGDRENPQGIVGLEVHANDGLLRSLAVEASTRNNGCGKALVVAAEKLAKSMDIKHLYLLTTTAQHFFERLDYLQIDRSEVSAAIRKTSEFSSLCPDDAVVMRKPL